MNTKFKLIQSQNEQKQLIRGTSMVPRAQGCRLNVVLVAEDVPSSTKLNLIQTQDEQKRLIHATSKVSTGPWMQPECRPCSRGRPKEHQTQFDSNTG